MEKKNGAQSVQVIPGRRIVLSAGVGKTNIDELKWLTDTVLTDAKAWKASGWAYIADCSKMDPVSPAEGHFVTVEEALDWLKTELNI